MVVRASMIKTGRPRLHGSVLCQNDHSEGQPDVGKDDQGHDYAHEDGHPLHVAALDFLVDELLHDPLHLLWRHLPVVVIVERRNLLRSPAAIRQQTIQALLMIRAVQLRNKSFQLQPVGKSESKRDGSLTSERVLPERRLRRSRTRRAVANRHIDP